ncbi:MAG TPA: hypothetical protein PKA83_05300 [Pirellulaceae bacterium]|nr:hypothetical protein [Pirellulaceae bacterium]
MFNDQIWGDRQWYVPYNFRRGKQRQQGEIMFLLIRSLKQVLIASGFLALNTVLAHGQLANVERQSILFTNNLRFEGKIAYVPELGTTLKALETGAASPNQLMMIDDGLRRIFLHKRRDDVANIGPVRDSREEFRIRQPGIVKSTGVGLVSIGPILSRSNFDDHGRRTVTLNTPNGRANFTQAVTKATPDYCELDVIGVNVPNAPRIPWKMHVSTSTIPIEVLRRILLREIDARNLDDRLRIVRFLSQAERFRHAKIELASISRDFPGLESELLKQYELLLQAETAQTLREIRTWKNSGNVGLANELIEQLAKRTFISSDALAEINDIRRELAAEARQIEMAQAAMDRVAERIRGTEGMDPETLQTVDWLMVNVRNELNNYNINRMASFLRLESDETISDDKKIALAASGWIIGSNSAVDNAGLAHSLIETKALVERYLSPAPRVEREEILAKLADLEGGDPTYVAKIVELMLPPVSTDLSTAWGEKPLEIEIEVPAPNGGSESRSYLVQLPPGYNPYNKHPCIITLHGNNTSPLAQVEWWAGKHHSLGLRLGLAARNGYIVIAPSWMHEGQLSYEYTPQEHARVMAAYRSALRRFSIDTDRVFLTGHYDGGDAAWDIGLSHPEHWAGVIPIGADGNKYVRFYTKNAKHVPLYFVYGERDLAARDLNATPWNRYLSARNDVFIVEYKGRGSEDFHEEIVRLYDWMNVKRRQFTEVQEISCSTLRSSDNYFWWLEVNKIKEGKIVHPHLWDSTRSKSDLEISAKLNRDKNEITGISGLDGEATIWFYPGMIDFTQRFRIAGRNGFSNSITPSTRVLLEDVRRRGERQYPFWAKVDLVGGRWTTDAP